MEGKKEIKISLGTVICICIIIVLIMGGILLVLENTKLKDELNKKEKQENVLTGETSNNTEVEQKEDEEEYTQTIKDSNIEKLKANTYFVIDNIEKSQKGYKVTANILNAERKELSQDEFNKILKDGYFIFRGAKWDEISKGRKTSDGEIVSPDYYFAKSGKYEIVIGYDKEDNIYYFGNVAGAKSDGLADYSGETVEFEMEEIDDIILNEYNNTKDGYSECKATVHNGEVVSIEFLLYNR